MNHTIAVFSSEIALTSGGIGNTTYYLMRSLADRTNVIGFVDRAFDELPTVEIFSTNEVSIFKKTLSTYKNYRKATNGKSICLCLNWRYAIVPFLTNSHYIVMAHGNDVETPDNPNFRIKAENILRKQILKKAKCICANSEYTANLVKKIRNDYDPIIIHPCSGETVDFDEPCYDEKFLLSIGRLEERKGFQYAIEAFAALKERFDSYKYYIAGDGPYRGELERIIGEYQLEEKCILLGRISEEEKQRLLKTCTLLVMPSFFNRTVGSVEGFGIVYIEANAHGKPVIGTRSGGIPDAIVEGETGLLVNERNVEQLEKAMNSLLSKEITIDEYTCKKWAEKHYYTEIARQYFEVIESLE